MAKIVFNTDIIKYMSLFTKITQASVKDCIDGEKKITFIVEEGQVARAIGKKGVNVKKLENKFKKKIRIIEHNADPIQFIKNVVYPNKVTDVTEEDGIYTLTPVDTQTRGLLIGRNASHLREYETIIKRYFEITELKVV